MFFPDLQDNVKDISFFCQIKLLTMTNCRFLSDKIVNNDKLQKKTSFLERLKTSKNMASLDKESTQLVGSELTCIVSEEASVHKQTISSTKREFK